MYFLSLYNVGIFVIMNDSDTTQCNVFIPEAVDITKGLNAVISHLHHYLEKFSYGEKGLHFHANNCVDQHKNNALLANFAWRIIKGCNKHHNLLFHAGWLYQIFLRLVIWPY